MELSVLERIMLLNLLPGEGTITTLKTVKALKEGLAFTEGELDEFEIRDAGNGQVHWSETKARPKEVEISPRALILIAQQLKQLSAKEKLPLAYVDLWERFDVGE